MSAPTVDPREAGSVPSRGGRATRTKAAPPRARRTEELGEVGSRSHPHTRHGAGRDQRGPRPGGEHPALPPDRRGHRFDHALALDLWTTGIHEARILASMVDDPTQVTRPQMEAWVRDFDSLGRLRPGLQQPLRGTPYAFATAKTWVRRDEEFVKRAGFTLIAERAVRDREHDDAFWVGWLPVIRGGATTTATT